MAVSWAASKCRKSRTQQHPRILPNHCRSLTLQHHGSIVDCSSHGQTRSKLPENILIISGVICLLRLSGIVISFLAFFMGDGLAEEEEADLVDGGGAKAGTLALMGLLAWVILMIGAGAGAGAGVRGDEVVTVDGDVEACVGRGENVDLPLNTPLPMPVVPQTLPLPLRAKG